MRRVVIFGAGKLGGEIYENIMKSSISDMYEVVAFCDNDISKWGTRMLGCKIVSPDELEGINADYVIISTIYVNEIKKELCKRPFYDDRVYISYEEFASILLVQEVYYEKYNEYPEEHDRAVQDDADMTLTIYTAITGNYDELKEPDFISDKIKYVCFTNSEGLKSDIWDIRYVDDEGLDNAMLARKIKILPNEYMDIDVDVDLCWVDGKFRILDDLRVYVRNYRRKESMLLFPHFERRNICDEMVALTKIKPEIKKDAILQTANYLMRGFADDYGLFDTGCIYRDYSDTNLKKIMSEWWNELCKYTVRDQLSLPYVLEQNSYIPDICDLVIINNRFLKYVPHRVQAV